MVHHYLEDHPDYERASRCASPYASVTPCVDPVPPFVPTWSVGASDWIVAHRAEVEALFTRLHRDVCATLGPEMARRMAIMETARMLEAAAQPGTRYSST